MFQNCRLGVLFSQFSSPHPGACPLTQAHRPPRCHGMPRIAARNAPATASSPPPGRRSQRLRNPEGDGRQRLLRPTGRHLQQQQRRRSSGAERSGVVGAKSATALENAAGGCGCKCHLPVPCTHQEVSKHQACKPRPSTQSMPSGAEAECAQQHTWFRVSAGLRPWPIVTTAITAMTPPTTSSPAGGRRQRAAGGREARRGPRLRSRLSGLGPVAAPARPRGCTAAGRGSCATWPGRQQRAPAQPPEVVRTLRMLTLLAAQALPRCPVRSRRASIQLARLHGKDVAFACEAQGGRGA